MTSSLKPFPTCSAVNLHVRPTKESNKVSLDVKDTNVVFTCSARKGVWFLCHTRSASGWMHGKDLLPHSYPAVFIVNDELPPDAQIRLRAMYVFIFTGLCCWFAIMCMNPYFRLNSCRIQASWGRWCSGRCHVPWVCPTRDWHGCLPWLDKGGLEWSHCLAEERGRLKSSCTSTIVLLYHVVVNAILICEFLSGASAWPLVGCTSLASTLQQTLRTTLWLLPPRQREPRRQFFSGQNFNLRLLLSDPEHTRQQLDSGAYFNIQYNTSSNMKPSILYCSVYCVVL